MGNLKLTLSITSIILICTLSLSCSSKNFLLKLSNDKQIDKRLVGIWEGSEKDNQIDGMTKEWKMTRTRDGKFILDFKATLYTQTQEFTEKGNWWVKEGVFYEFHEGSGKTDTYKYKLLNQNQVKFKAINLGVEHANEAYEFIDTRVN